MGKKSQGGFQGPQAVYGGPIPLEMRPTDGSFGVAPGGEMFVHQGVTDCLVVIPAGEGPQDDWPDRWMAQRFDRLSGKPLGDPIAFVRTLGGAGAGAAAAVAGFATWARSAQSSMGAQNTAAKCIYISEDPGLAWQLQLNITSRGGFGSISRANITGFGNG